MGEGVENPQRAMLADAVLFVDSFVSSVLDGATSLSERTEKIKMNLGCLN
jgi:hypothetical protein